MLPSVEEQLVQQAKAGDVVAWEQLIVRYQGSLQEYIRYRYDHRLGAYGRDASKKRTAQFSFNHIMCPPMVLWLCEASGVETSRVVEAMKNALTSRRVFASQCAAIRKVIPWSTVDIALRTGRK
jgi:hypothetical protein